MEDGYHKVDYPKKGRYEGELNDGKPDGQGIMKYADGDVYEGEFKDGKPHGQGIMKYADGDVYEGEWEYGEELLRCEDCSANLYNDDAEWCTICKLPICPKCVRQKSKPIECDECEKEIGFHMSEEYEDDLDAEDKTIGYRQGGYDQYKND